MAVSTIKNDFAHAYVQLPRHNRNFNFYRSGHVVNAMWNGDWTDVPKKQYIVLGTIPSGFEPTIASLIIPEQTSTGHDVALYLNTDGTIGVYSYLEYDITSATNGRYNVTYIV